MRLASTVGGGAMVVALVLAWARPLASQRDTSRLAPITVSVTRDHARSPLDLPYAISVVRPDSNRPGQRHLTIDELLLLLPGITVANRYNPAQDPRISIRGFGARSAFGVRSIRVLRDGIPLTLPDGQTPVDYLDLESVGSIEAIRGTASALYGNAGGGVIDLHTAAPPLVPFAGALRASSGSFNTQRWVASLSGTSGAWSYQADGGHTTTDGFRGYSRQRVTNAFGRAMTTVAGTALSLEATLFDEPLAESPGAITAQQLAQDPTQADALSVLKRARKIVRQGQLGLTATHAFGLGDVTSTLYGGWRNLKNPLTFAIVNVDRVSGGGSVRGTLPFTFLGLPHRASIGVDAQYQHDDRHEWTNCNAVAGANAACVTDVLQAGTERGAPRKNQLELVESVGPFVRIEAQVAKPLWLSAGLRADYVRFEVDDHLVALPSNPDDSGERTLSALSPMLGATWRVGPLTALYGTISSAFETPTATELGNKPDGSAGLNPELRPQYSITYESGVKGFLLSAIQYDIAAFMTRVRDELVPYEVPDGSGRRYFHNAGRTERKGGELGLGADVPAFADGVLRLGASYSYSDFRFTDFTVDTGKRHVVFTGKRIPGIPIQQGQVSATWSRRDLFATIEGVAAGSLAVDDGNTARSSGYQIANVRIGSTGIAGASWLALTAGIQNALGRRYAASVSVNAAAGKYYEPAPGRVLFLGATVRVRD
ncbi:MAG: TonB-dependent receptor [Gemmatimonadaceae bacterium]